MHGNREKNSNLTSVEVVDPIPNQPGLSFEDYGYPENLEEYQITILEWAHAQTDLTGDDMTALINHVLYGSEHGPDDDSDVTYSTPSDEWIGVDGEPTPDTPENGSDTGGQSQVSESEDPEAILDTSPTVNEEEMGW